MSFMGTVGIVAQQAQPLAGCTEAPTAVSTATSSSGNYDWAVIITSINTGSGGEDALASNDGSGFSGGADSINFIFGANYSAMLNNNSGVLKFGVKAYMRATGASSFSWVLKDLVLTDNSSAISSSSIAGTYITGQDGTGSASGIGKYIQLDHNSGGRGYMMMFNDGVSSPSDRITFTVKGTATNACGSSVADGVDVTIEWQ